MKSTHIYRIVINGHNELIVQERKRGFWAAIFEAWNSLQVCTDRECYHGYYDERHQHYTKQQLRDPELEIEGSTLKYWFGDEPCCTEPELARDMRFAIRVMNARKAWREQVALNRMRDRELTVIHVEKS